MDNKRGLFLTNVLSKVFERVLDLLTNETVCMSEYQCGGQKERGTVDNMIMMRAVIDNNARLNKKTYCYFADAYKCFDKLWLKDCLVEMWRAGMREREIMLIYELNRKADIIIDTPVGITDSITVREIVKQGTVFGPKLCCISTEKVNSIQHVVSTSLTPEMTIGAPVYVDDILGIGSVETVERVIRNTREMEVQKKFRFSKKKSKYMMINTGRDKTKEVNECVNDGVVDRAREYKYLGWWFNEKNNADRQMDELESKVDYMIREIQVAGHRRRVGTCDAEIQLMLYRKIIVPTLTYNMETASNLRKADFIRLEKMQGKCLRRICGLPESTPYWGMMLELGVKPLEYEVHHKRLMLYHNIMNSNHERIARQIIQQQQAYQISGGFYSQVQESAKCLLVNKEQLHHYQVRKCQWKNMVQYGTSKKLEKEIATVTEEMTKLRSIKKSQLKESAYVRKCSLTELTELLKLRLHMTPLKCNYGSKSKCKICMLAEESDEHMLECPAARIKVGYEINASMNTESKCELKEISRYMESVIKIIG